MDFVIDTNISISILIKPKGKVYEIFRMLSENHSLFISEASLLELKEHQARLLKLSVQSESDFELLKGEILSHCIIAASKFIPDEILINAYHIVSKYDKNNMPFVATAIYLNALLWTSDKKLLTGLRRDGFMQIVSTKELVSILGGL